MQDFSKIPREMREYNQWICWRYENRGEGKPTKVPYCPIDSTLASINNPGDWTSFDIAVENAHKFSGIGFVLTLFDPYCFVDLDASTDPNIVQKQIAIHSELDSYSELSPGGGLHVITRASIQAGRRRDSVELYSASRFMTMTGNVYNDRPIRFQQSTIDKVWADLEGVKSNLSFAGHNEISTVSDLDIYNEAASASNGEKFLDLWNGDIAKYHDGDHSRADFALVDIIAFYTQDRAQIARLFRQSGLGRRKKAQRNDYMETMITRAFDRLLPPVDISGLMHRVNSFVDDNKQTDFSPVVYNHGEMEFSKPVQPTKIKTDAVIEMEDVFTPPPGVLGEISKFIYSHAYKPVPQIAVLGALGFMAGIAGRAYNASGNGLNLYILLLARTGRGKDAVSLGYEKLFNAISPIMPTIRDFKGPGDVASGQALNRYMGTHQTKSFVSVLGEFGPILKRICSPLAFGPDLMTQQVMLKMWSQSGKDGSIDPTIYSDSDKNTQEIKSPAFSFFAECAPEWFDDSVDVAMISTGLLPRFLISEYDGIRVPSNKLGPHTEPSQQLIYDICAIATCSLTCFQNSTVCNIQFDNETEILSDKFEKLVDSRINANPDRIIAELWNRAHLNVVRISGLVAVGLNCYSPVITRECWEWAEKFVVYNLKKLEEKFNDGVVTMVNTETESAELQKMENVIIQYITADFEKIKNYGISKVLYDSRVIPYAFFQRRLSAIKPFSKAKIGPGNAIKRAIQNLIDNGDLSEISKRDAVKDLDFHGRCFAIRSTRILEKAKRSLEPIDE